jgi:outer membrane protein assembly factor BamB
VGLNQHNQIQVTGGGEGKATITVTTQGVTGEMTVTVQDRARLAWSLPLPGTYIDSDITIGADGTIYVVTSDASHSTWFAVSPQGGVLWSLDLPRTFSTPAIGADGTMYVGLLDGGLVAVNPGGTVRWTRWDLDGIRSSPALGADGTIYVAGLSHVYAVDPRGELEWTFETAKAVFSHSSPAVASDGTVDRVGWHDLCRRGLGWLERGRSRSICVRSRRPASLEVHARPLVYADPRRGRHHVRHGS